MSGVDHAWLRDGKRFQSMMISGVMILEAITRCTGKTDYRTPAETLAAPTACRRNIQRGACWELDPVLTPKTTFMWSACQA